MANKDYQGELVRRSQLSLHSQQGILPLLVDQYCIVTLGYAWFSEAAEEDMTI